MGTMDALEPVRRAAARTVSVREVVAMSDAQAFERFRAIRWGPEGEAVCPGLWCREQPRFLPSRRQRRFRACRHTFSVTSVTILPGGDDYPLTLFIARKWR
jgi:hypothetical protein